MHAADPTFVVDAMLGRLAQWLRILGYDTRFDPKMDDPEIARVADAEGRIVLTRDRGLLARRLVRGGVLVDADDLKTQLSIVRKQLGLTFAGRRLFTRCGRCNVAVESIGRDQVRSHVPPKVERDHDVFARCPCCAQIYWGGTHASRARDQLRQLLNEPDPG